MSVKKSRAKKEGLRQRPPVVVVLGHVDHGKTTLLDTIRKTNVVARESGSITQHVGASVVEHRGRRMTFLDTPGHEAFSAMRSRGAQAADVAVLVVAADDGVKPQTREAIDALKRTDTPFVVALNKIDKANADVERVKTQLTEAGVLLEGWGGSTPNIEISAKAGTGLDELLDLVALVADLAELRADPAVPAEGVVIEAHRDPRRGAVATLLVKNGTLRAGDAIVAGAANGKVKALEDFSGRSTREAKPSEPATVLGLSDTPNVGDTFRATDESEARAAAQVEASRRSFERTIAGEGVAEASLRLFVKADVLGSLEAMLGEFEKFRNPVVAIEIVGADTGDVSENDVRRAEALRARIFAFRVKAKPVIAGLADRLGVVLQSFDVIYELFDAVKRACEEAVPKRVEREEIGSVKLLATFKHDPPRQVIGGRVTKGVVRKGTLFEIERGGKIVGRGSILEVQAQKVPVDEVEEQRECGILARFAEGGPAKEGDTVRAYTEHVEQRKIFA